MKTTQKLIPLMLAYAVLINAGLDFHTGDTLIAFYKVLTVVAITLVNIAWGYAE